ASVKLPASTTRANTEIAFRSMAGIVQPHGRCFHGFPPCGRRVRGAYPVCIQVRSTREEAPMSKTIVITGATGSVASQLIPLLTSAGVRVRAMVRNPGKAAALAAQGVALVEGDLDRPRTLGKAFDGADAAMI